MGHAQAAEGGRAGPSWSTILCQLISARLTDPLLRTLSCEATGQGQHLCVPNDGIVIVDSR